MCLFGRWQTIIQACDGHFTSFSQLATSISLVCKTWHYLSLGNFRFNLGSVYCFSWDKLSQLSSLLFVSFNLRWSIAPSQILALFFLLLSLWICHIKSSNFSQFQWNVWPEMLMSTGSAWPAKYFQHFVFLKFSAFEGFQIQYGLLLAFYWHKTS